MGLSAPRTSFGCHEGRTTGHYEKPRNHALFWGSELLLMLPWEWEEHVSLHGARSVTANQPAGQPRHQEAACLGVSVRKIPLRFSIVHRCRIMSRAPALSWMAVLQGEEASDVYLTALVFQSWE